jgi:GNAT superfamily N-acetyltransferase
VDVVIGKLRKNDFKAAREFAIDGMNLSWYTSNKFELYFYSKYFLYMELSRATKAIGAFINNELAGVVLADINNEPKLFSSIWHKLFVMLVSFVIKLGYRASNIYDEANKAMLKKFKEENEPDGELNFFVVDPKIKSKGIGSILLEELENEAKGKLIYLYSDTGSTYQFYSSRGFNESGKNDVVLELNKNEVSLTCFSVQQKVLMLKIFLFYVIYIL